ncbi:MAG: hypothetical protein IJY28_03120, partial [Clostridia bacterium]|nr:hypothetical protein [Clostridia bacterium]
MKTRVKVAIQMKPRNVPGWPCINYDYDKELLRITGPLFARNPEIDFDLCKYTSLDAAKADYERDLKNYDGVLVLMMTNWTRLDQFYIQQSRTGLPVIVADVPYCGSGGMLEVTSPTIRSGGFPVPMVASLNYNDIADAAALFGVIKKM